MKKLTRKLFLSVAALAVCAATLVSTTFAWYVSNQTASANGVTGATAAIEGNGSVFISKNGEDFYKTVAFGTNDYTATGTDWANKKGEFKPITTNDSAATFTENAKTKTGDTETVVSNTTNYLVINLWLRSDKTCTVNPVLKLTNTTPDADSETDGNQLPVKDAYVDITGDILASEKYTIDAAQALRMAVSEDGATAKLYEVDAIAKNTAGTAAYTVLGDVMEDDITCNLQVGDDTYEGAHGYYYAVMNEAPLDVDAQKTEAAWAGIELIGGTAKQLTITIWLEGADISCFDGCAGQSFQFDFDFTVAA